MANFIKFTLCRRKGVRVITADTYINVDAIATITPADATAEQPSDCNTVIALTTGNSIYVAETFEEVSTRLRNFIAYDYSADYKVGDYKACEIMIEE